MFIPNTTYIEANPSIMANLKHENIIKYYEHFQYNLLVCMVFEYFEI